MIHYHETYSDGLEFSGCNGALQHGGVKRRDRTIILSTLPQR